MLTDLAVALAAQGHEVSVVTSRQLLENPGAALPAQETRQGVRIRRLRTTTFGRQRLLTRAFDYLSFYVSALFRLLVELRRGDTVIAKTDPPLIGVIAALAAKLKGARLINWLQDVYPEIAFRLGALRPDGLIARLLLALRNWSLRRAAANVAVGERMKTFLEKNIPDCAPVSVIHNWSRALPTTAVPGDDNPYRQQLGLRGKVVFCYSGNLGRVHEFGTIVEAAAQLREREDIHFLIIGGGAQTQAVQNEVRRRGLASWSFLPYQPREKLAESLGAADVHLISLKPELEGLVVPSKLYGVLAAGRPILYIGDREGEVGRILRQRCCGLTCAAGAAQQLATLMRQLADSGSERQRLGANAALAHQHYHDSVAIQAAWRSVLDTDAKRNQSS